VTVVSPPTETVGVGPEAVDAAAVGPTSIFTFVKPAAAVAAAAAGTVTVLLNDAVTVGVGPEAVATALDGSRG
jgi:hypothetical protein